MTKQNTPNFTNEVSLKQSLSNLDQRNAKKLLKKFYVECLKVNINMQPLIKLLQTLLEDTMATLEVNTMVFDETNATPIHMNRQKTNERIAAERVFLETMQLILTDSLSWLREEIKR